MSSGFLKSTDRRLGWRKSRAEAKSSEFASGLLGFALVTGPGTAQQAAPTENKGVKTTLLTSLDLGTQVPGMEDWQLRLRRLTVEPGGVIAVHSHKDRPTVIYVLKGTYTDLQGDLVKEHRAGSGWSEDISVTHWVENKGKGQAAFIVADILKQP